MNDAPDKDLCDHFAALRREDAAGVPSFAAVRATPAPRPRRHVLRWAGAIAVAGAAIVVAFGIMRARQPRQPLVSLATTHWQSPTDFLLRVPGAQYLETAPRLTL